MIQMTGEEFVKLMEECGITPKDLGITPRYKQMLKKNERKPSQLLIQKLITLCKKESMKPPAGFEPATTSLQGWRKTSAKKSDGSMGMEQSSIPVPSAVPSLDNSLHYGTNPFSLIDINKEVSGFLEFARTRYSKKTFEAQVKVYVKYVKMFAMPSLLSNELTSLGKSARKHVLKVGSVFAKYLDAKYNTDEFTKAFQRIRKLLGLKWYVKPELPSISQRLMDPVKVVKEIVLNIESTKHRLFAILMLSTGLRTNEATDAWENFFKYYREIDGIYVLELMKERGTKKTYFAFITEKLASVLKSLLQFKTFQRIDDSWIWKSWKRAALKAGYDHRAYPLYFLRRANATLLRRALDPELVDLLQGRAPRTVLDKHYNVESLRYLYAKFMETVGKVVDELLEAKT